MGVYSGLQRDSFLAKVFQTISLIGISLPTFLIGILLIYCSPSRSAGCRPSGAATPCGSAGGRPGSSPRSGLKALILPSVTLGLFQMTLIMRLVRAEMLEVLRTDYIKFARARGLTNRAINFGHALKNTLVPVITIAGLQLGSVIAFAIITETVFQWPGMGLLFVQAVQNVDIPIMAAYLMLVALIFVVINLASTSSTRRRSAPAIVDPAAGLRRDPWPTQSKRRPRLHRTDHLGRPLPRQRRLGELQALARSRWRRPS